MTTPAVITGTGVNDFRARLDAALGKGGGKLADEIERFKAIERHRDHLHDCLQRAERERDEARAEIDLLRARVEDYHRSLVAQSALLHTTSNERDEARAEIERLRAEKATDAWHTGWQEAVRRMQQAERQLAEAVALLRDGAVLIRGYGDGKYPDYPEGLLVAIDKWLARLDAFLAGGR